MLRLLAKPSAFPMRRHYSTCQKPRVNAIASSESEAAEDGSNMFPVCVASAAHVGNIQKLGR